MSDTGVNEVRAVKLIKRGLVVTFEDGMVALFPDVLLTALVSDRLSELKKDGEGASTRTEQE